MVRWATIYYYPRRRIVVVIDLLDPDNNMYQNMSLLSINVYIRVYLTVDLIFNTVAEESRGNVGCVDGILNITVWKDSRLSECIS